jgi:hypothetical protein
MPENYHGARPDDEQDAERLEYLREREVEAREYLEKGGLSEILTRTMGVTDIKLESLEITKLHAGGAQNSFSLSLEAKVGLRGSLMGELVESKIECKLNVVEKMGVRTLEVDGYAGLVGKPLTKDGEPIKDSGLRSSENQFTFGRKEK